MEEQVADECQQRGDNEEAAECAGYARLISKAGPKPGSATRVGVVTPVPGALWVVVVFWL